jgi:UDP-glucose 4-epimerase
MVYLITGGAGFIGSHLVDRLMNEGKNVRVIDNLASGSVKNIEAWVGDSRFEFTESDILDPEKLNHALLGAETVFHFAANPEVRSSKASPLDHFDQNIKATFLLLEETRKIGDLKTICFASTSTVYGEAEQIPTPEGYGPMKPISLYGASKLACESLISAYAFMYGFKAVIYRLANIVGPRSNHGVIWDFVGKLRSDSSELEVLGDGLQSKSYLYVSDCVEGMLTGVNSSERVSIFNLGSRDRCTVLEIAEEVKKATGASRAKIKLTGGVEGGRGWKGDVKLMQLDMTKLASTGWSPRFSSLEAVRMTAEAVSSERL